jgi:hypothetical protein
VGRETVELKRFDSNLHWSTQTERQRDRETERQREIEQFALEHTHTHTHTDRAICSGAVCVSDLHLL